MDTPERFAHIPGWGADLDPADRPAYPKERIPARLPGLHWDEPAQQPQTVEVLRSIERATKSTLHEMTPPSVDEVNDSRKSKFMDAITEALADDQVPVFRELIQSYADEHDTPLADIAAALAASSQNGDFLMKEPPRRKRDDRDGRGRDSREGRGRFEEDRGGRGVRDRRSDHAARKAERAEFTRDGMSKFRISVGRRQHVRPGAIVGAIANEGGLTSKDFGHIDIRGDHPGRAAGEHAAAGVREPEGHPHFGPVDPHHARRRHQRRRRLPRLRRPR